MSVMSLPAEIAAAQARADAAPLTAKILALPARFPYQYDEQAMLTHAQVMEADRAALLVALRELEAAAALRETPSESAREAARAAIAQAEARS